MKTKIFLLLKIAASVIIITFSVLSCKEEAFNPGLTEGFTLKATSNGATYKIKVALPTNYDSANKTYGTVYLLDGDENFGFVANKCRVISDEYSVENVFVVSIGYGNDRNLDYTPTQTSSTTGGAPKFLEFIKDQLIPNVQHRYSVDTARSSRVILGHSFGGLFGAYAFAHDNKVFGNYILLSPSIWYDNEVTLRFEKDNSVINRNRKQLVFMGIGEMENSGRMQAPFEAFYQTVLKSYPHLVLGKNREPDLDHVGSKNPNISHGLEYYFKHRSN
jgi:predicted alpha/beta superfamily hydrolase